MSIIVIVDNTCSCFNVKDVSCKQNTAATCDCFVGATKQVDPASVNH
jgi:hypothetical protein